MTSKTYHISITSSVTAKILILLGKGCLNFVDSGKTYSVGLEAGFAL